MADLHNLLDEINNDAPELEEDETLQIYDDHQQDQAPTVRASIPAALAAAADQRDSNARYVDDLPDAEEGEAHLPDPEYEQLKSLWTQELACPELMPSDAETVSLHVDLLEGQEETIEDLLQRSKEHQRQFSTEGGGASGELASLMAQITKMDLDRTRFMLVDLARVRMAKIENHALHNKTMTDRMTEEEVSYLRRYGELIEKHYRRTVLNHLPKEAWKKLDEPEMIDSPNLEEFVFCRVLEPIQIDLSGDDANDFYGELNGQDRGDLVDTMQEHAAGSYLIVMYKTIRDLVLDGKVELLM